MVLCQYLMCVNVFLLYFPECAFGIKNPPHVYQALGPITTGSRCWCFHFICRASQEEFTSFPCISDGRMSNMCCDVQFWPWNRIQDYCGWNYMFHVSGCGVKNSPFFLTHPAIFSGGTHRVPLSTAEGRLHWNYMESLSCCTIDCSINSPYVLLGMAGLLMCGMLKWCAWL